MMFSQNLFEKLKNWSLRSGPGDLLGSIHTCAYFPSKWVIFFIYILSVLEWKYDDFLHFWKLFEKSTKIEVFAHWGPVDFLAQFTHVHIFHPNKWNFIVLLSWSENMMTFFIFENFSENIEVFAHCGPGDLFGSIHTCAHFPSKWVNFYILVVL